MAAADAIRNYRELTTGDFVDFEVLHNGEWRAAQLSRSALQTLSTSDHSDRQTFDSNLERIAAAAQQLATSTPDGEKIKLGSYDF
ncbi:hypothetical protein [Massilia timonae]|uniref:hypothetical protein n=1 Tax=Massilia timonae TaxID=47229 RepID=UPI0028D2884E|nr:hypothetical protein [Massilia timonae]